MFFLKLFRSLSFIGIISYAYIVFYGLLVFQVPIDSFNFLLFGIASIFIISRTLVFLIGGFIITRYEVLAILILSVCWGGVIYNDFNIKDVYDLDGLPALEQVRNHLAFGTIWLFVGAAVSMHSSKHSDLIAFTILAIFCVAIVLGVQNTSGTFLIVYEHLQGAATESSDFKITHLSFSHLAIIIYASAYAFAQKLRPIVFVLGALALFPLESRSAFFIGVVSILIFEFVSGRGARLLRVIAPIFVASIAAYLIVQADVIDFQDSRFQRMLIAFGLEEDGSALSRSEILSRSWKGLPDQFFFGDATLIVKEFGYVGDFIHNLLSAWQYFGFLAFVLIAIGLLSSLKQARIATLRREQDAIKSMGFILLIYICIGITFSHFVAHKLLWFSLGFWLLNAQNLQQVYVSRRKALPRIEWLGIDFKDFYQGGQFSRRKRRRKRRH
ncbi:MAG: hypothetical protein AB8D52_11565 [Gammaproteobacteria bacterium]